MDFNKYKRNACAGEWVWFYPRGERVENERLLALVTRVTGLTVSLSCHRPTGVKHMVKETVRHIDDPHWEGKGRGAVKQKVGAWDFHEVYGSMFTKYMTMLHAQNERMAQLEEQKKAEAQLTSDEYEALKALEMHGPVISRISEDTGMSIPRLDSLPKFNEAFKAAKLERWEAKNAKQVDTDDIDDEDVPGGDVEYARSGKDAMNALGMTADEWDELKAQDGFPKHQPGKGWPMGEVRAWMEANMAKAES